MSIAGDIIRRTQITGSNHANYQVSRDAWNESLLVISTQAPDGALMMRDSTQASGWGFTTGPMLGMVPESRTINGHPLTGDLVLTKADVGLGLVENIELSTWGGSSYLATVGIITSGQWHSTIIKGAYGGTGSPFVTFQGPTYPRIYTLPDQDATIFSTAAPIPIEYGGTGVTTGLTQLNAGNLTAGIIPTARYGPEVVLRPIPLLDLPKHAITHETGGVDPITSLNAGVLTSGTIPIARLPPEVVLRPLPLFDLPAHHDTHNYGGSDAITSIHGSIITVGNIALARLPMMGTTHILGRASPGLGPAEELIIGPGLMLDGFTLIGIAGAGLPGGGDVFGPTGAVPDNFVSFNGVTGKVIRDSGISSLSLVRLDVANTFTAPQTVSGVFPSWSFIETDAALDQKRWRLGADAAQFMIEIRSDINAVISTPVRVARNGTVTVSTLEALAFTPTTANSTTSAHGLLPTLSGSTTQFLNGMGAWVVPPFPAGDVVGPASAIDNDVPLFSGTTGKLLKDSGILITQLARRDQTNTFTAVNIFNVGAIYIEGVSAYVTLTDTSQPADQRTIVLADRLQGFYVRALSDAGVGVLDMLTVTRAGHVTAAGTITSSSDIYAGTNASKGGLYSTLPVYPGQYDTGWTRQSSYWLAAHASYGLYSNTGLYLTGNFWVAATAYLYGTLNVVTIESGNIFQTNGYFYPANVSTGARQSSYYLSYHPSYSGLYTNGSLLAAGSLYCGVYLYPGAITGNGLQSSWFLAAHSSYGLYTNTGFYVAAGLWVAGTSNLSDVEARNIYQTGGWLYPAAYSSGARQLSYYLASHSSYGLYINGGLYLEAGLYASLVESRAHVRAAGGLYDYGRGYPICTPQGVEPLTYFSGGSFTPGQRAMSYARAGKMMFVNFFFSGTLNATTASGFALTLPEGATFFQGGQLAISVYAAGAWEHGLASFQANGTYFLLQRNGLVDFPQGAVYLALCGWVPIN